MGSAINQDGRSSGLTAPNGPSQTSLISTVLHASGLAPSALTLVAVHGTGTTLGDPIEVSALGAALLRQQGLYQETLAMGSVKACFGHTEGAAGVTGWLPLACATYGCCIPNEHASYVVCEFSYINNLKWSSLTTPLNVFIMMSGYVAMYITLGMIN